MIKTPKVVTRRDFIRTGSCMAEPTPGGLFFQPGNVVQPGSQGQNFQVRPFGSSDMFAQLPDPFCMVLAVRARVGFQDLHGSGFDIVHPGGS